MIGIISGTIFETISKEHRL